MRILLVTPYLGATYGGISKVVQELATKLGLLGMQIDVVTTNANDELKLDVPTDKWLFKANYRVRYFDSWHRSDLIFSRALISWLFFHAKDYDIVHTHTLFSPVTSFTHSLCHFQKIPYIITPHGMLEPWALAYKAWKKRIYYIAIEKAALCNASAIQVLADSEAEHVKELGNHRTILVPNGIHPEDFSSPFSPESFYQQFPETRDKQLILFLGRIDPKKGLDLLALAFAQLHSQFLNVHLIVAGPNSIGFLPTVKGYFTQFGCLDAVTFTGMITGELKKAALSAASVYIAPSYSEGFSMSVLEGMASGLPCIITTGCNFPEAATAKAALVVNVDARAIGEALVECFQDMGAARALGTRARNFVLKNYTWEQSAKKLIEAYASILSETAVSNSGMTDKAAEMKA